MSSNKLLFFVIALAACLTQFAADIYAPSLPAVALSLNTTIDLAQWSMAIYLFGVALTLLIYGPLSDAVGRKQPMVIGLCIMAAGSVVAMLAPNIKLLILGRFIQGCGRERVRDCGALFSEMCLPAKNWLNTVLILRYSLCLSFLSHRL